MRVLAVNGKCLKTVLEGFIHASERIAGKRKSIKNVFIAVIQISRCKQGLARLLHLTCIAVCNTKVVPKKIVVSVYVKRAESGITFSTTNRSILDSRLKERLREKQMSDIQEYYKLISSDKEEMKLLLDSVTTNLTRFFRNQPHFDALENYVIPHVLERKKSRGDTVVKIWSAGCSTGEEPYTIAMILKKILPPPYTFEIIASDLSLKSLMVGKQGFYDNSKITGIPPEYLDKYMIKRDNGYQVCDDIMKRIRFDYHNLKYDAGPSSIDNEPVTYCILFFYENSLHVCTLQYKIFSDLLPCIWQSVCFTVSGEQTHK